MNINEIYSGEVYNNIYGWVHTVVVKWSDKVIWYETCFGLNSLVWPLRNVNTVVRQMSVYIKACTIVYNNDYETMIPWWCCIPFTWNNDDANPMLIWYTIDAFTLMMMVMHHYYILTKNPTAVMSYFRHFPVACTTLWFFLKRRKLVVGYATLK